MTKSSFQTLGKGFFLETDDYYLPEEEGITMGGCSWLGLPEQAQSGI